MPNKRRSRSHVRRSARVVLWLVVAALAVPGAMALALFVGGAIEFAALDCGPRSNWTEENYIVCSDIDETNPLFLIVAVLTLAPLALALLIRLAGAQMQRNG